MTKRYREPIEVTTSWPSPRGSGSLPRADVESPAAFAWRGSRYRVVTVLGHWREDAAYWSGGGIEVPQRDLWRVEARRVTARVAAAGGGAGVYELVCEGGAWRLDRVWD